MKAEVSIVTASWMWLPEQIVEKGDITMLFSRVVVVIVAVGVVAVGVVADVGVAAAEVVAAADAEPPITDFSPIMHPLPIFTGPS